MFSLKSPMVWICGFSLLLVYAGSAFGDLFAKGPRAFKVGPNPTAVIAADLNDDGLPEIITADTGAMSDPRQERPADDEISVLTANAPLDYTEPPRLRADFAPYAIAVGNVDALKAPDIVAGSFLDGRHHHLSLFRNMGDGIFETVYFRVPDETLAYKRMFDADNQPVFSKPGITGLVLADFNHDGFRDVVATGWSSDVLIYFPGNPNTYFGEPKFIPAAEGPRDIKAADFDGDGNLDLVVALYCSNEIGLWKGKGDGTFEPATRFLSRGRLPSKIQVADVNRDGHLDIVVSHCYTDDSIVIFYGDGKFGFSTCQEIVLGADRSVLEHEIRDLVVADLNGDGRPDLAVACSASRQVAVFVNESGDTSIPQRFREEKYAFDNGKPRALAAADLNKDGAIDLVVALGDANSVEFLLGTPKPQAAKGEEKKAKEGTKGESRQPKEKRPR